MNAPAFTRRQFTAGLGAHRRRLLARSDSSLAGSAAAAGQPAEQPQARRAGSASIADGTATVFTGKVELGQGILTALRQIAAEELDLPLERIRMILRRHRPHAERGPDRRQPVGREQRHGVAHGGAEVRAILLERAAKRLGAAADN